MKQIIFYLDFISPYAWLAFERLPLTLQGISHSIRYRPVLFGAILAHHGQLGPAEIAAKRDWTYRQVLWLARQQGTPLQMPAEHPFNPLPLLRLATACDAQGEPNRHVVETVFRHVWAGGESALAPGRLQALQALLKPAREPDDAKVKQQLKAHTDEALARGVFGVPSFVVDGRVFWGQDALPMLRDHLLGDEWFAPGGGWDTAPQVAVGVQRRRAT
jgi:2-hydroxychromene-2-carboxylate isomerase